MKQRNYRFDNIKGIMIFLVVFGHLIGNLLKTDIDTTWLHYIVRSIFSFHMPVFVFISGYFSAPGNEKKAITRYLIPYLLANTLFGLLGSFINSEFSFDEADPFSPHWTLWYLLSLFFWKVLLSSVLDLKYPLLITIIVALITGMFSADYYLSLSRTIAFFPYFIAGYLVKEKDISNIWTNYISRKKAIAIFIAVEMIVLFFAYKNVNGLAFQLCRSYANMDQSILTGVLLRLFSYVAGAAGIVFFFSVIPNKKGILSALGKYSITVYLAHSFSIRLITKFVQFSSPIIALAVSVIISLLICIIFGNRIVYKAYSTVISGIAKLLAKDN